ncbi:MAG TPA: hydroxyacid dehydrogenase [Pirellulales bacterium]|nr:hydroxyacid dehydrogenase [Pirellulales bacterium]
MRTFRVAFTGDYLNEQGESAYGDLGIPLLEQSGLVRHHFLRDQGPRPGDREYWNSFYKLEVRPEHLDGVDGLVVLRPWVKRSTLEAAEELVVIGRSGAGYDKIDVAACTDHDVALFNAPLGLHHSTASSALLFMLALAKRLPEQERMARSGDWSAQAKTMGGELQGRTLGIVGLGNSGRELARLVAPFQMRLIAYSPHADRQQAAALGITLVPLDELMREADFVSIHSRLTAENHRTIGAAQIALMKPTAFFVNVARGELVDQPALIEALRARRIAGAGLDVFEIEPLPADNPLVALDNVILTPHWNASTTDVWRATGQATAAGILRVARGEIPENVINREVLERPGFQAKLAKFAENREASR